MIENTERAELEELEELEALFRSGIYTPLEMPMQYVLWLSATRNPKEWWSSISETIRVAIREQLAKRHESILVGGETMEEYPAILERLARELEIEGAE